MSVAAFEKLVLLCILVLNDKCQEVDTFEELRICLFGTSSVFRYDDSEIEDPPVFV